MANLDNIISKELERLAGGASLADTIVAYNLMAESYNLLLMKLRQGLSGQEKSDTIDMEVF